MARPLGRQHAVELVITETADVTRFSFTSTEDKQQQVVLKDQQRRGRARAQFKAGNGGTWGLLP